MKLFDFKNSDMDSLYEQYRGKILSIIGKTEKLIVDEAVAFNSHFVFKINERGNFNVYKNKDTSFLPIRPGANIKKNELLKFINKCKKEKYLIVGEENLL